MRSFDLFVLVSFLFTPALLGCSGDSGAHADAGDQQPDAGGCEVGPAIARDTFVEASIDYLQSAFSTSEPFVGGDVVYGEMWVPLEDSGCPIADWTTLGYVTAIEPALVPEELRATHTQVAVMWALNGRKFIVYLDTSGAVGTTGEWQGGRLPDSLAAVASEGAATDALEALAVQLADDHPTLTVTWLASVRILTVDGVIGDFATEAQPQSYEVVAEMEAAAASVRASGLFTSVDWSGLVFRIPNESRLGQVIDAPTLSPECLRQESRPLLEQMTTSPALAPPLGTGPLPHQPLCE